MRRIIRMLSRREPVTHTPLLGRRINNPKPLHCPQMPGVPGVWIVLSGLVRVVVTRGASLETHYVVRSRRVRNEIGLRFRVLSSGFWVWGLRGGAAQVHGTGVRLGPDAATRRRRRAQ
jgi:hypothetical protein